MIIIIYVVFTARTVDDLELQRSSDVLRGHRETSAVDTRRRSHSVSDLNCIGRHTWRTASISLSCSGSLATDTHDAPSYSA